MEKVADLKDWKTAQLLLTVMLKTKRTVYEYRVLVGKLIFSQRYRLAILNYFLCLLGLKNTSTSIIDESQVSHIEKENTKKQKGKTRLKSCGGGLKWETV